MFIDRGGDLIVYLLLLRLVYVDVGMFKALLYTYISRAVGQRYKTPVAPPCA